jgi:predicted chitinase
MLCNIEPGDGFKFRGRGGIQLAGRDNYKMLGSLVGWICSAILNS